MRKGYDENVGLRYLLAQDGKRRVGTATACNSIIQTVEAVRFSRRRRKDMPPVGPKQVSIENSNLANRVFAALGRLTQAHHCPTLNS